MLDGHPGDHPLNDVLVHGGSAFSPVADDALRQLARYVSHEQLFDLLEDWLDPPPIGELESLLLDTLEQERRRDDPS